MSIININTPNSVFNVDNHHSCERYAAPIHDPRFAEIEQIMCEVGIKFIQVVPYAIEYLPSGVKPITAQCANKTHVFLININTAKQFLIQAEAIGNMAEPARLFNIHDRNFFEKLARHLRQERALSLIKYWFVRIRLWWNK